MYLAMLCASRHACSRIDATLFWTCIKIAKALRDFHGEDVRSRLEWRWDKTDTPVNGRHHNQTVLGNFIYVF